MISMSLFGCVPVAKAVLDSFVDVSMMLADVSVQVLFMRHYSACVFTTRIRSYGSDISGDE